MKKTQHPFMQLLMLAAVFLLMTLVANVITLILNYAGLDLTSVAGTYAVQAVAQLLMFFLPVILVVRRYYHGSEVSYMGLRFSRATWGTAAVGVAATILLVPAVDWLTAWNDTWYLGPLEGPLRTMQAEAEAVTERMLGGTTVRDLALNLLVMAFIPALCEEVFFRAGIQGLLARWLGANGRRWGLHLAIWITAIVFSLAHAEIYAFVPRLLLGALLGYLFVFGGSLLVNVTAHFINNAAVVVTYWLWSRGTIAINPSEPLAFDPTLTFCCTLAALLLLAVTLLRSEKR